MKQFKSLSLFKSSIVLCFLWDHLDDPLVLLEGLGSHAVGGNCKVQLLHCLECSIFLVQTTVISEGTESDSSKHLQHLSTCRHGGTGLHLWVKDFGPGLSNWNDFLCIYVMHLTTISKITVTPVSEHLSCLFIYIDQIIHEVFTDNFKVNFNPDSLQFQFHLLQELHNLHPDYVKSRIFSIPDPEIKFQLILFKMAFSSTQWILQ